MTRSNTILIAGGAGFIGLTLTRKLLDAGNRVVVADNFSTSNRANLDVFIGNPCFEWLRHDVTEPLVVEVDEIYSLACPASPVHYQANPIKTLKTSFMGTRNLLGLAKRTGARFLQASTSEVYGDPLEHPQREQYWGNVNPIGVRGCYDEGKRVAESLCAEYRRQHEMPVQIARIFNTYGPGMQPDDGRVVSNFIVQALRGQPVTIFGDGEQTRSFCYVDDLCDGLIKLMALDSPPHETWPGPINLGNDGEFTIAQLADLVEKAIGPLKRDRHPLPPDDPARRRPDLSRAKALLGWAPTTGLEAGLKMTIAYFKALVGGRA
jgi:UDP-glucuronate decarboxylase